jgi:hypothetical protein
VLRPGKETGRVPRRQEAAAARFGSANIDHPLEVPLFFSK